MAALKGTPHKPRAELRRILAREHSYWRSFYEPDEVYDFESTDEKDRWGRVTGERVMKIKRED